jgi:hypothetical protein
MNNFIENESSVFTVRVINENDRTMEDFESPDNSRINFGIHPEGGNLVAGTLNNVGLTVTGCNGNPTGAKDGTIVNSKGEVVSNFIITKSGYAKFYLRPEVSETYKAVVVIDEKPFETVLPKAITNGIAIEANSYALPGKTIIKLRTNPQTALALSGKPLFVAIHQNNKSDILETSFAPGETEKELVVANDMLYNGINTIRVIDADLWQYAERTMCLIPESHSSISFSFTKTDGKVKIYGRSDYQNADISISVLPENSLALERKRDIFGSLMTDPYLLQQTQNAAYWMNDPTKAKKYELDLFLLNQPSAKYKWQDMVSETPKLAYDFDIGLAVKGTINKSIPNPKKYRMLLSSPLSLINDYAEINDKNEFIFKNLVFGEKADFKFTLLQIPSIPTEMKLYQQVLNRNRSFNKLFKPQMAQCAPPRQIPIDIPVFGSDVIALENVNIAAKAKSELLYRLRFGNGNLRGYKVTELDKGISLLAYLESNGFGVSTNGNIKIYSRLMITVNAAKATPEISLNGRILTQYEFDELRDIKLEEVDEVYLNPHAIVASIKNNIGVIKIYMKKLDFGNAKPQTKSYEIKEGFAALKNFENPVMASTTDTGFRNFGVVQWIPTVLTDDKGAFSFDIPQTGLKTVTISVEGFTPDGQLISERQTVVIDPEQ